MVKIQRQASICFTVGRQQLAASSYQAKHNTRWSSTKVNSLEKQGLQYRLTSHILAHTTAITVVQFCACLQGNDELCLPLPSQVYIPKLAAPKRFANVKVSELPPAVFVNMLCGCPVAGCGNRSALCRGPGGLNCFFGWLKSARRWWAHGLSRGCQCMLCLRKPVVWLERGSVARCLVELCLLFCWLLATPLSRAFGLEETCCRHILLQNTPGNEVWIRSVRTGKRLAAIYLVKRCVSSVKPDWHHGRRLLAATAASKHTVDLHCYFSIDKDAQRQSHDKLSFAASRLSLSVIC